MLVSDDDVEVLQHSEDTEDMPGQPDPMTGADGPSRPEVHSVKIKRKVDDGRTGRGYPSRGLRQGLGLEDL
jgi:hypothetical protein